MLEVKVEGFDRLIQRLEDMRRGAESLDGTHKVPMAQLFPPAFMAEHTEFESFQAMMDASGLFVDAGAEDVKGIFDSDAWNSFVEQRTKFEDWKEMLRCGGTEHAARMARDALGFG